MLLLKKRSVRFYLGLLLVLALTIGGSAIAAFASTGSGTGATVAVTGGSLSETGPSTVSATPVTLTGDDQTTTYSLGLTVNDPRGTAAGWNLTITSTTFTGTNSNTNQLSTTASSIITAPAFACISGGGHCTDPDNAGVTYPVGVPAAATAPTAVKFFDASAGFGLGKFSITPTVTVSIPANTIADTYTSTVSVAVVSGP
jgi:putative surface cell wall-binding protein